MTIKPLRYDFRIYQGATLDESLPPFLNSDGSVFDLSGYTAQAMAREYFDSETAFMDISTEDGGIVINTSTGVIRLYMSPAETDSVDICNGYWDIELTSPSGSIIRYAQGKVCVKKSVTRGASVAPLLPRLNFSIASNSQYLGVI